MRQGVLKDHVMEIAHGRIVCIVPAAGFGSGTHVEHLVSGIVVPGFIDLQVNPIGIDFALLSKKLAQEGCTGFLAALITQELDGLNASIARARGWMKHKSSGAKLLGIHLEGPFLNPERRGIHPLRCIQKHSASKMARLLKSCGDTLRMMTLAPEISGGMDLVKRLSRERIIASIGHSNATYAQAMKAFDAGANSVTHLFNACRPFHHRDPGIVGAALENPGVWAQIIPDGVHVHPSAVRMAYAMKGKQRLCAVTDALVATSERFSFAGQKIKHRAQGFYSAQAKLAGSSLTMAAALRNLQTFVKAPIEDLIECVSLAPATLLGLDSVKGSLEPGKDADLAWLDDKGRVQATWVEGEKVYVRDHRLHR